MFGLKIVKEKDYNYMVHRSADMEYALYRIRKWFGEFPHTNKFYINSETNTPVEYSYGYLYGSDGERDYMRNIADIALKD